MTGGCDTACAYAPVWQGDTECISRRPQNQNQVANKQSADGFKVSSIYGDGKNDTFRKVQASSPSLLDF